MTISETSRVIAYLQAIYPGAWKDSNQEHVVASWADLFPDDDMHSVMMACKALAAASRTIPTPADVKAEMYHQRHGREPSIDAWNHIRKAISNSGYNSEEEFARLTPVEQRLAGSARQLYDWSQMDVETLDSVVASNIQRAYQAVREDEKRKEALPAGLNQQIEALANRTFRRLTDGK